MTCLNHKGNKQDWLIGKLEEVDKRYTYNFFVNTCYLNIEVALKLIKTIQNQVKIADIFVLIDADEAIRLSKEELQRLVSIGCDVSICQHSRLFHSKNYALIRNNSDYSTGVLVVGSANLTKSGFYHHSNYESLISTTDAYALASFIESINAIKKHTLEDFFSFDSIDLRFMYTLLKQGIFAHKWSDSLGYELSVKYALSEEEREKIKEGRGLLRTLGFDVDAATVSKNYFKIPPSYLPSEYRNLITNYGLECQLGYWFPKAIIKRFQQSISVEIFKNKLISEINNQLETVTNVAIQDYKALVENKIIYGRTEQSDLTSIKQKLSGVVSDLTANNDKLTRIITRFSFYDMPYTLRDEEKIKQIYNELESYINSLKRNKAITRVWVGHVVKAIPTWKKEYLQKYENLKLDPYQINNLSLYNIDSFNDFE